MSTSYDDFLGEVQHRIEGERKAEAARTTRAVLETSYGPPASVDRGEAVYRSKAAVALSSETVPGGETATVEDQLPEAFEECFEFVGLESPPWDSEGRPRPTPAAVLGDDRRLATASARTFRPRSRRRSSASPG